MICSLALCKHKLFNSLKNSALDISSLSLKITLFQEKVNFYHLEIKIIKINITNYILIYTRHTWTIYSFSHLHHLKSKVLRWHLWLSANITTCLIRSWIPAFLQPILGFSPDFLMDEKQNVPLECITKDLRLTYWILSHKDGWG